MEYFIADCHFNHKNITKEGSDFDGRGFDTVEEMNEKLVLNWNKKVTNDDDVYILGDMFFKTKNFINITKSLKGKKHLIVGNHDFLKNAEFTALFEEITPYKEIKVSFSQKVVDVILCHYPIAHWNKQQYGSIHLYGHLHNDRREITYQKYIQEINSQFCYPVYCFNVGCMHWNYTPVSLSEILDLTDILLI